MTDDRRAEVAAEREATIREHDVDADGHCIACKNAGEVIDYPCEVRLRAEMAARALANRPSGPVSE